MFYIVFFDLNEFYLEEFLCIGFFIVFFVYIVEIKMIMKLDIVKIISFFDVLNEKVII